MTCTKLTCTEFVKQIADYQIDNLSTKELAGFLWHLETCKDCEEELAIYYLLGEGLSFLEEGDTFDLAKIMTSQRERAEERLKTRRNVQILLYVLYGFIAVGVGVILFTMYF